MLSLLQANDVEVTKSSSYAAKPDVSALKFGHHFSDHMLEIEWTNGNGWGKPKICPLHSFEMHPGAKCLHYATEVPIKNEFCSLRFAKSAKYVPNMLLAIELLRNTVRNSWGYYLGL